MATQFITSVESFTANLTREPIVSSVDRRVTIFVLKLGKRFEAVVAFISYTRVFIHVRLVVPLLIEAFLAHFAVVLVPLIDIPVYFAMVEPLLLVFSPNL